MDLARPSRYQYMGAGQIVCLFDNFFVYASPGLRPRVRAASTVESVVATDFYWPRGGYPFDGPFVPLCRLQHRAEQVFEVPQFRLAKVMKACGGDFLVIMD